MTSRKTLQKNPWLAALALSRVKGLGKITARRLIEYCGGTAEVFVRSPGDLIEETGLPRDLVAALFDPAVAEGAEKEFETARRNRIDIFYLGHPDYPPEFEALQDPPPVLYCRGSWKKGERRLAVVGTRRPSRSGVLSARRFSAVVAASGAAVVSGLARGIDTEAHEAALEAPGRTYAVLGSGLLNIYPRENAKLADRICGSGAVISEFDLFAGPENFHFPLRNRLISAFSDGVLVVEAPRKSGALITADLALEQGKDVLVVPGSIHSKEAEGSNAWLKQGAACVTEPADIWAALGWPAPAAAPAARPKPAPANEPLFPLLSAEEPADPEDLALRSGLGISETLSRLARLEAEGVVTRLSSGYYVLSEGFYADQSER